MTVTALPVHKGAHAKQENTLLEDIFEHISTVVHVLLIGLCIYVVYLCFLDKFTLVTWHAFLYTVGWILLMTESTLFLTKENIFSKRITPTARSHWHWVLQFLAVGLSLGGFGVIVYSKKSKHFVSDHALTGLISTVLAIPTCLNGIMALFNVKLKTWIKPNVNKLFHACCGFATIVIGAYAIITGYYTNWFKRKVQQDDDILTACFVVTVIIIFWALFRPMLNGFTRAKNALR